MNDLTLFRETLSELTGIPVELLTGDTAEAVKQRADVLSTYKAEYSAQNEQSAQLVDMSTLPTREQFGIWMNGAPPIEAVDPNTPANKYPAVADGGELIAPATPPSTRESFADYFGSLGLGRF